MSKTSKSPAKRAKLEPLSVEEALSSPAAEGMFSFLNIRPEELLRPRALADIVHAALPLPDAPGLSKLVGSLTQTEPEGSSIVQADDNPGIELNSDPGLTNEKAQKLPETFDPGLEFTTSPELTHNAGPGLGINYSPGLIQKADPGLQIDNRPGPELLNSAHTSEGEVYAEGDFPVQPTTQINPLKNWINKPGVTFNSSPGLGSTSQPPPHLREATQRSGTSAKTLRTLGTHVQAQEPNNSPGLELTLDQAERSLLVSEVRYTVRRARLVQDGHTSNEQKLYEYLWTHGETYDEISRRVSIGFRTLASRVRMARASAQKNLRALMQKLALEIIEGFDVTSSKAPTYRVFNYTDILRRREIAGMIWYVRRTQAVRFVDSQGREIVTASRREPGLELINSPGLSFDDSSGLEVGPAPGTNIRQAPGLELGPQYREKVLERTEAHKTSSTVFCEPPLELVKQAQQTFPAIDHLAIQTLWNECRVRAGDCTVAEILHFINQKLPIARNGRIQNPIGFVLTSVPKCFEGQTFQVFRQEEARRRQEQQRREEEEREERLQFEEQNRREAEAYRKAEEALTNLPQSEHAALYERIKSELKRNYPHINWPNREALEDRIRIGMIRELQKRAGV